MKSATGIVGLDAALYGGFPSGRTTIVTGATGTGKTVLGMQFLVHGAVAHDEPGLLLSFEESPEKLEANFTPMSMPFPDVLGTKVHLIDGRPPGDSIANGAFEVQGLIAILASLARTNGAKRVVIDGVDAIFASYDDAARSRVEITRLLHWLAESGMTALMTMKAHNRDAILPDLFGFAEFAADGVVQLRSNMYGELLQRVVRVVKMRGSAFVTGDHAYTIGSHGFRVLTSPSRTIVGHAAMHGRCSSGVERLDRMLEGGYRRGTTTLISGLPGSAKTTFGAAFLANGCASGERALFIGFDEPAEQMLDDVLSVGIDLAPFVQNGSLRMESFAAGSLIGDEHYLRIEALVDEQRPDRIVIDPVSALVKAGGTMIADMVSERLIVLFKSRGLTALFTAVSDSTSAVLESTSTRISTVADTWIHLSFASAGGERNRTLTIVKSRGTAHSPQMREVVLASDGVSLADVYSADGAVLFGAARLEREQQTRADAADEKRAIARVLRQLDEDQSALTSQRENVDRQLDQLKDRRAELAGNAATILRATAANTAEIQEQRQADPLPEASDE